MARVSGVCAEFLQCLIAWQGGRCGRLDNYIETHYYKYQVPPLQLPEGAAPNAASGQAMQAQTAAAILVKGWDAVFGWPPSLRVDAVQELRAHLVSQCLFHEGQADSLLRPRNHGEPPRVFVSAQQGILDCVPYWTGASCVGHHYFQADGEGQPLLVKVIVWCLHKLAFAVRLQ